MKTRLEELQGKIDSREARIGVIGLGYVGLPLALEFAKAGFPTVGIDVDHDKVRMLTDGRSYIGEISDAQVDALVKDGRLSATTKYGVLGECDAVSICVPTPLSKTRDPDLSYVVSAADAVAEYVHAGMLIVLESTTYPGTTEEIVVPRMFHNNLHVGQNVFVAFSPERIDPGRTDYVLKNTPKVIGGVTERCVEVASARAPDLIAGINTFRRKGHEYILPDFEFIAADSWKEDLLGGPRIRGALQDDQHIFVQRAGDLIRRAEDV